MAFDIEYSPAAERQFDKLTPDVQRRVLAPIEALADDPRPHGVVKLVDRPGVWRIRIGDYRVVYSIEDKLNVVRILKVGIRNESTY